MGIITTAYMNIRGATVLISDPIKTKLPMLSTNINLTGTYCVLTSENRSLGISAKIRGERREELQQLIKTVENPFGIVFRTNCQSAQNEAILAEYDVLKREYEILVEQAKYRTVFSCMKSNPPGYLTTIQGVNRNQLEEVVTDLPEVYEELQKSGSYEIPLRFYEDSLISLASIYNLEKQIERALGKTVWLPGGGYLVIEPTEALTVIDVNTGKSIGGKYPQEHFLKVNKEAAKEVARQLRLRNISGIVIVDFIDLRSKEDKQELLQYLTAHVKADPVPVQVVDMTKLDLVELTRKKVSKSLKEQLT